MESIWRKECELPKRDPLTEDMKVEVAVIGAGMAGLLTAFLLNKQGIKTIVLEANEIASGQTRNTTAKITSQHALIYDNLIEKFGKEKAGLYARANEEAIGQYAKIIEEEKIACHFERLPAYLYTLSDVTKIEKEVDAAKVCGIPAEFTTETALPFKVPGSAKFLNQAQFNPLEFIAGIINPLTIYEHTLVKDIDKHIIYTTGGNVKAENIVVAAHYPFINAPGYYFMRMHQERAYVLALNNAGELDGMYRDENQYGYSFRSYKDMILLGGGEHRTGENISGGKYEELEAAALRFYPEAKEVCRFSAQDCSTLDGIPYIGQYSAHTSNLYVTTGFKKWGMTTSMVSASLLCDMIRGKKNPYEEVFTPQRFQVTASMENFLNEAKHTMNHLILKKIKVAEGKLNEVKAGEGRVVEEDGEKIGVYKDLEGKIYQVSNKCTHLGCQLTWNADELSWDCPCHGSRFDYTGNLLNNPALENIEHE